MLYLRQLQVGPMQNFTYLVGAADSPEVVVVDPAWEADTIARALRDDGKQLAAIFVSHHHGDHINAVPDLLATRDVPVYAQREEIAFSTELRGFGDALRPLAPGDTFEVGPLKLKALHTPGHTPGSQCLHVEDALLSGDTVFVNACGRCDLRGGDPEAMYRTIQNVLLALPAATRLFPGHDYGDVQVSSLERERERNPYFQYSDVASFVAHRMRPRR